MCDARNDVIVHWFWAWVVQIHCSWSWSVKRVRQESDNRTRWIYGVMCVVSQKGGSSHRSFAGQKVSSASGHGGIHVISSIRCVMSVSLKSRKIDQQERQPPPTARQASCIMHARDQQVVIASEQNCERTQLDRMQVSICRSHMSTTAHNRAP